MSAIGDIGWITWVTSDDSVGAIDKIVSWNALALLDENWLEAVRAEQEEAAAAVADLDLDDSFVLMTSIVWKVRITAISHITPMIQVQLLERVL